MEDPIKKEMPTGNYCQDIRTFGDSFSCPDLDDAIALLPKCTKYGIKKLDWDTAGHIRKCEACLRNDEVFS